jgi:hypothetical protein
MPERMGHTEPFQSGQNTVARDKAEKVPIKFDMSKVSRNGIPDPLKEAIAGRSSYIPRDMHEFRHGKTSRSRGALYHPMGEFGTPKIGPEHKTKATGIDSHTSRPGGNPLGSPKGGRGGNPLTRYERY